MQVIRLLFFFFTRCKKNCISTSVRKRAVAACTGCGMRRANATFRYEHSTYDDDRDEIKIFTTEYASFAQFWQMLTKDKEWFYQHPLYVHPEQRSFCKRAVGKGKLGDLPQCQMAGEPPAPMEKSADR